MRFLQERGRINIHGLGFLEFQKPCKFSRIAQYRILFYQMHRTNRLNFGSKEREVPWPPYSELCQAFHHNIYEAAKILLGDAHDAINMRSTATKVSLVEFWFIYIYVEFHMFRSVFMWVACLPTYYCILPTNFVSFNQPLGAYISD
ncbi:uncharacterized protein LOC144566566 [Carex rostrata]